MTAAIDQPLRTSISYVVDGDDGPLTGSRVLRMFDQARHEVARQLTGSDGSGAGYDGLRLEWPAFAASGPGDVVTVTALLGSVRSGCHEVDYVATATTAGLGGRTTVSLLAQAHGWTVADGRPREGADRRGAERLDK